jgi:hypothetical protein
MQTASNHHRTSGRRTTYLLAAMLTMAFSARSYAEQPPAPCHPNPSAAQDEAAVLARGDVAKLPAPLQDRLGQLANRPHSQLPLQAYAEADGASQLFQYYLLDTTGFEPNVSPQSSLASMTTHN